MHICAIYFFIWKKNFKKATTYLHLHPFFYSYINHLNFFCKSYSTSTKRIHLRQHFFLRWNSTTPNIWSFVGQPPASIYIYTYMTMFWSCVWVYFVTKNFGVRLKHNREYDILCRHTYYLIRKVLTIVLPT